MKTTSPENRHGHVSDHHHLPVVVVLFFLLLSPQLTTLAGAQTTTPPPNNIQYPYARFTPSMAIIIVVLIAALFLMGFFSIYIRHCSDPAGTTGSVRRALSMRARRAAAARGLERSVIDTFPTFSYSEVKDHKIGKGALECAVCLNEFEEDETLRLLPKCDHVFHPECIDAWLESHVTCPVCRANLSPQAADEPVQELLESNNNNNTNDDPRSNIERSNSRTQEIVIDVSEDQNQHHQEQQGQGAPPPPPPRSWSIRRPFGFGKFRSHSTGHSFIQPGQNLDRFTLRLPEQVRKEVMDRATLNRTRSQATTLPREGSSRRGYRTGEEEGTSRAGGRFYRRIERPDGRAKSDRWAFFTRALSMKSPKVVAEGEDVGGSSSSGGGSRRATPVKMPSFKCLEPKAADETGLFAEDSARHAV